ncbi:type IV pilus biogenesis protein PilM [Candidatus Xianfuyuplasma coldseepsis]|uniref:Pilus assembly protein PilM n=1 Tax=Candidatus Xianfuyuplasma coldseepsis TaxID=2782163 RepID=A0A7L7KTH8_9MOLU|nr:pilus assembly protein PilM [Xianfuyuplasma coldseepsis]QMS85925.1 pilus assembly protein PilM [Xianfuyuplasma coldseepsis]
MARLSVNCFFTDNEFNFIEKPDGYNMKKLKYSSVKLPPGTIENGIIYREEALLKVIKDTFKLFKIKARRVNLIVHEELFTFRTIEVPIIYKPNEIGNYIESQIGKTIMIPFDDMKMDYVIHRKTEDSYDVIMFYAPKHELKSYVNLFYEMNMQVVRTDIPPLSLHRLFYYRKYEDSEIQFEKDIMFLAIFDDTYSIYIFDQEIPIFSLVQNLNVSQLEGERYLEVLDQEMSKISNYYKYNLNAGDASISKIVLFNMSSKFTNDEIQQYFYEEGAIVQTIVFDMKTISKIVDTLIDRECYIPLAASLPETKGLF